LSRFAADQPADKRPKKLLSRSRFGSRSKNSPWKVSGVRDNLVDELDSGH
jgi:hypothetical protein